MKEILLLVAIVLPVSVFAQSNSYPIKGVEFTKVKLTDNFWLPRIKANHTGTIPASFERCEATGRVKNFEMAAAKSGKFCTIFPFDDTDIYKTIEGASFSMALIPDKKMDTYVDSLIIKIAKAQESDGYLYTARTIDPANPHAWSGTTRWEKEGELSHELYNSGHLFEAAAAHYYATGKKTLLNIALKNADLVCNVFGPGKRSVAPGHEIVEMGLVKLYLITGKKEYLETAKFFIDARGQNQTYDPKSVDPWKNGSYWQDHKPVTEQYEAEGHAVRALYLYSGMADVAALTNNKDYLRAIDSIWQNVVQKKIYVQGSLGAVPSGERFGGNYELPNTTAYNETCAAIANVYWNYRMFLLHGDARYIDVLEKTLYNGLISGIGLDGKSFFYSNAMQVKKSFSHKSLETARAGWFDCSCCPTNVARFIPSIPGYMYAQKDDDVYVNLFATSQTTLSVHDKKLMISQENNYPWDGKLKFIISPAKKDEFALRIRIPGWAQNQAMPSDLYSFKDSPNSKVEITVNGKQFEYVSDKGYAVISRTWKKNDMLEINLPMEVRKLVANQQLKDNIGKLALQRGPLVYCAEGLDNDGSTSNILLPKKTVFSASHKPELLNGITVIEASVTVISIGADGESVCSVSKRMTAIPY